MGIEIYLFILLTLIAALFSGSESAIFSLTHDRINYLKQIQKSKSIYKLNEISNWIRQPQKTISALLLASLFLDVLLSELGHHIILKNAWYFYLDPEFFTIIIITIILLIFVDVIPKVLGLQMANIWNLFWFPILYRWFQISNIIFTPVHNLIEKIVSKIPHNPKILTEKDLLESIQLAQEYGVLKPLEEKFLTRSIIFHYDTVYTAMIPREKIFFLDKNESLIKTKQLFNKNQYRFSIIYQDVEQASGIVKRKILGYLHIRSLLLSFANQNKSFEHKIEPILFFPETILLKDALSNLIKNKMEIAIVIDESGDVSGLITLRHIVNKLVGNVGSDTTITKPIQEGIQQITNNSYRVLGSITVNDFNTFFKTDFYYDDIETISGYIIQQLDGFPKGSTVLQLKNLQFYDMKLLNHKIKDFLVKIHAN